jgi:hypothetical protein
LLQLRRQFLSFFNFARSRCEFLLWKLRTHQTAAATPAGQGFVRARVNLW